jgi:predicted small lipoprotein YifL
MCRFRLRGGREGQRHRSVRQGTPLVVACVLALTLACGQKGPPLPPLHLVPAAPGDASVARVGGEARIRFTIPSTNLNGPGAVNIDRLEIFAATVAPGAAPPANRELLLTKHRVGTIPVKPAPVEGETPPENAPPDTRPSAGEHTTFLEKLTADALQPEFTAPPPKTAAATAPATAAAARAGGAAATAGAAGLAGAAAAAAAAVMTAGAAVKPEEPPPT